MEGSQPEEWARPDAKSEERHWQGSQDTPVREMFGKEVITAEGVTGLQGELRSGHRVEVTIGLPGTSGGWTKWDKGAGRGTHGKDKRK